MSAWDPLIRLRFFDADGKELDTVIIYQDGNSASVPARTAWVEVSAVVNASAITR